MVTNYNTSFFPEFRHISLAIAFMMAVPNIGAAPNKKERLKPQEFDCPSAFVIDNKTDTILENKNGDELQPTASLAKLFTLAGARIASKGEESEFKSLNIQIGAPTNLKPGQIFHFESCKPHIFQSGKKVKDIHLSIPEAINATMTVSANPISYRLFDHIVNF